MISVDRLNFITVASTCDKLVNFREWEVCGGNYKGWLKSYKRFSMFRRGLGCCGSYDRHQEIWSL